MLILIDDREGHPWTFRDLRADKGHATGTFTPPTRKVRLRVGDYTAEGCVDRIAIERKSAIDLVDTMLGFKGGRRDRFFDELSTMQKMARGIVIVEADLELVMLAIESRGQQTVETRRRAFMTSLVSAMHAFPSVPFFFAGSRRAAEVIAFKWLVKAWEKEVQNSR